jgi:hypothetical protein
MTMAASAANVVSLETHPAWRATDRRSAELRAAMMRHPSYQGPRPEAGESREDAVILMFRRR